MALAEMKCPSCGAPLKTCGNHYECEYCGNVVVELATADAGFDTASVSLEELKKRIACSKKTFTVNIGVPFGDVDAEILEGKLNLADKALREGKPYEVDGILKGVPETLFAAERLRLFAETGARDEAELASYAGDITKLKHYDTLIAACTPENREIYEYVADRCKENAEVKNEILKGEQLIAVQKYDEALKYAEIMVGKYPARARAWLLLMEAKCAVDPNYNPFEDMECFKVCPDVAVTVTGGGEDEDGIPENIPRTVRDRCRKCLRAKNAGKAILAKYVVVPLLTAIVVAAAIGLWQLFEFLTK